MRFNGRDIKDIHKGIVLEKEIPPGMPGRSIETARGWNGETFSGAVMERGVYTVRVSLFCRTAEEGWRLRALLAEWATSSGNATAELEPTHWPGMAYDAIVSDISEPDFFKGTASVTVTFALPRPVAHEVTVSRAEGSGSARMLVGGSMPCRPTIRQTLSADREGLVYVLDGKPFLTLTGDFSAGQVVEADTARASLTIDGVHAESRVSLKGTVWRPGFAKGAHTVTSSDAGRLEVRWNNEWA